MKEGKIIKILIPLIAVIVVFESVVLVSKLDKNVTKTSDMSSTEITSTEEVKEPVADFVFETETKEMKVGKSYQVNLSLVGSKEVNLDAIELYLNYDPDKLTVSKLTTGKDLPEAIKDPEINTKTGLISSVFLWDVGEVYSVIPNKSVSVLSFTVTPKVAGETEITLVDSDNIDTSSTLLVESVTSNQLLFLSNKLEISAVK